MNDLTQHVDELSMPVETLGVLQRRLRDEAGDLTAIQLLRDAGYEVGAGVYASFVSDVEGSPDALPVDSFWERLSGFLESRGWGAVLHEARHPGVGVLKSHDWAEARGRDEGEPSCSFSAGMFSHLLTEVAGDAVAVLEVTCRASGDDACCFAYGSVGNIHELYRHVSDGKDLDTALGDL